MRFSVRNGLIQPRSVLQVSEMDDALRNGLWDVLDFSIWDKEENSAHVGSVKYSNLRPLFRTYWHEYFKMPVDGIPYKTSDVLHQIRTYYFGCPWNEVYDFMEFSVNAVADHISRALIKRANIVLERELSGWRFVGKILTPISSPAEIESIGTALKDTSSLRGAHAHLESALSLLSDRANPDYRNSVKESISAVESIAQSITGEPKSTLAAALKTLEKRSALHPALKSSLTALYGYTSDSDGIRHAMLEESSLTFTDAKFMLVACTAFINYLVGKAAHSDMTLG